MDRLRLLDLYCGAGGCSRGYDLAGFEPVGVDLAPMPRYPYEFYQDDALAVLRRLIDGGRVGPYALVDFDVIHASPPCQFATDATKVWRAQGKAYPNLIGPTRELLKQTSKPYIIENVTGAAPWMDNPVMVNGAFFGLRVHRERLFETSFPVPFDLLPPSPPPVKMGRPVRDGEVIQPVGHFSNVPYARREMGISWMTQGELAQAIPPAYTEYIGRWAINYLDTLEGI